MISIKYIGLTLKDIIFSIILSACINGIHLNRNFLFILLIIFLLLNTTNLMKWKIYHANQRRNIGIWLLFSIILVISFKYFFVCIIDVGIWIYMLVYDFCILEINALKYEDEMQFVEKVRIAQNFNNTVLLDQYAKEKMVRYLQRKNKVSKFLRYFPLIWKTQISIYRLGRTWIIMGMILFMICLGICKMPICWTLPFFATRRNSLYVIVRQYICRFSIDFTEYGSTVGQYSRKSHRWSIYTYIGKSNCETVYGDTNYNCLWRRNYNGFCCKQRYSANTVWVYNTYMCDSPEFLARSDI